MNVLYLHGFASSPAGRKVTALRTHLAGRGVAFAAPDLNVPSFERLDFDAVVDRARQEAILVRPDVAVGSSLGAMVALALASSGLAAPLVLVAPALGFGRRWTDRLPPGEGDVPFVHHSDGSMRLVHRAFFRRMATCDVDRDPPAAPVTVVMGRADESVPFDVVRDVWTRWESSGRLAEGSRFVEIADGDHGLVAHVGRIAEEIEAAGA